MPSKPLCQLQDIPLDGFQRVYDDENQSILIYREADLVFGFDATCPHMGGPLDEGCVDEGCIVCPWHGWKFDLKSGHCQNVNNQQLRRRALRIENGYVYLEPP